MNSLPPYFISQTEYNARVSRECVCGNAKEVSMLVCWDCFKRGPLPLKWFDGSYEKWLTTRSEGKEGGLL